MIKVGQVRLTESLQHTMHIFPVDTHLTYVAVKIWYPRWVREF